MVIELRSLASPIQSRERRIIREILQKAAQHFSVAPQLEVSIVLLSPAQIQQLNRAHRHKNRPTTTLSFPVLEGSRVRQRLRSVRGLIHSHLGEIFLCRQMIEQSAHSQNLSYPTLLRSLTLHSFLHLLGYDHLTKAEEAAMERIAHSILD